MTDGIENVRSLVRSHIAELQRLCADEPHSMDRGTIGLVLDNFLRELAYVEKCVRAHERLVTALEILASASDGYAEHVGDCETIARRALAELEAGE